MTIQGINFFLALVNMSLGIKKKKKLCHFVYCSEMKLPAQIQIIIAFRIVDIEENLEGTLSQCRKWNKTLRYVD
jgi:hypothetical protein